MESEILLPHSQVVIPNQIDPCEISGSHGGEYEV
jgi:hypothetical protein